MLSKFRILLISMAALAAFGCDRSGSSSQGQIDDSRATGEKIFGGTRVGKGESITNYVVGIRLKVDEKTESCTGAMIGPQIVLTAAHCVSPDLSSMTVYFTNNLDNHKDVPREMTRGVLNYEVLPHMERTPPFRNLKAGDDIALLLLKTPAPSFARHFQIPETTYPISQIKSVYVSGFGYESFSYSTRDPKGDRQLKTAMIPRRSGSSPNALDLDQTQDSGACLGDSGSPAYVANANGLILMGVMETIDNGGKGDACRGVSTFADVASHSAWIFKASFRLIQNWK